MDQLVRRMSSWAVPAARAEALPTLVERRIDSFAAKGIRGATFDLVTADGASHRFGEGAATFRLRVNNDAGARALATFDELAIAEAYLTSDIDLEGSFMDLLGYRALLGDIHPVQYVFSTYLEKFTGGQIKTDKRRIKAHYDLDPEFFTLWLDPRIRGYSHGFFKSDDESLEDGMERKFRYAMEATGMKPGDRVLDIGGGWGSFFEFAGKQGIHVTSITISDESEKFMQGLKAKGGLDHCNVIKEHLLEYKAKEQFDAIVNLGVTEHLPDYEGSVKQYERMLKPGRKMYLDAYSGRRFRMSNFVLRWVFEGNTSPLNPRRYFAALEKTDLEVLEFVNDRHDYGLTCKKWAENLERVHDIVAKRWGEQLYRRFLIYLWGSVEAFERGALEAHHMVLKKPLTPVKRSGLARSLGLI